MLHARHGVVSSMIIYHTAFQGLVGNLAAEGLWRLKVFCMNTQAIERPDHS